MGRYKYLFKNIGLLTLSSFATKLLSFFLVPLYTNILTTTEYGTYDLFHTTIGILVPILTLNIQESVIRFALDKKYAREALISIAIRYMITSSGIVAVGLGINNLLGMSALAKEYAIFFLLLFFVQVLSGIVMAYIRGIDKIATLSISSVVASVVIISCNIIFLIVCRWGLIGYFLANILGPLAQCLFLMLFAHVFKSVHLTRSYKEEKNDMLAYSKPMIANSIAWWVNNASDRYIVIFFCGLAESGIYSVASKIPSILNIFQNIFNQAWTLSAVKEFDPEDREGFFSDTYKMYNCGMTVMCSVVIVSNKILAKFLYAKDFFVTWRYVPWLTIAILFGALSGYIGGFFSAVKNSKLFAQSVMIGAVTNVVLNLILTPIMGAMGAAIATTVCYFVTWVFRYIHSCKYIRLRVNIARDLMTYLFLVVQTGLFLVLPDIRVLYPLEVLLLALILCLYCRDIFLIINKAKSSNLRK